MVCGPRIYRVNRLLIDDNYSKPLRSTASWVLGGFQLPAVSFFRHQPMIRVTNCFVNTRAEPYDSGFSQGLATAPQTPQRDGT